MRWKLTTHLHDKVRSTCALKQTTLSELWPKSYLCAPPCKQDFLDLLSCTIKVLSPLDRRYRILADEYLLINTNTKISNISSFYCSKITFMFTFCRMRTTISNIYKKIWSDHVMIQALVKYTHHASKVINVTFARCFEKKNNKQTKAQVCVQTDGRSWRMTVV